MTDRLITEYPKARDNVLVILEYAKAAQFIGPVELPTTGALLNYERMTEEERQALATLTGTPTKRTIAAACKFAGVDFAEAQARRATIADTEENRKAARGWMGLGGVAE